MYKHIEEMCQLEGYIWSTAKRTNHDRNKIVSVAAP